MITKTCKICGACLHCHPTHKKNGRACKAQQRINEQADEMTAVRRPSLFDKQLK